MKIRHLLFLTGVVLFSSSAFATELTCQSFLSNGNGNFSQLEAAGSCDVGNVMYSAFTTSYNPTSVVVAVNGFATSPVGSILGLTYSFLSNPGTGTIGYIVTFDSNANTDGAGGIACPPGDTCGLVGVESQLNSILSNGAVIGTVYSGGFTGTSEVDAASLADETYQATNASVVPPASITELSTYNGSGTINTFSSEVITADLSQIPEPATSGLIGFALFGLGCFGRKKLSRH